MKSKMKSKINIKNKKYKGGRVQYPLAFGVLIFGLVFWGLEILSTWVITSHYNNIPSPLRPVANFLSSAPRNTENKTCWKTIIIQSSLMLVNIISLYKVMTPTSYGSVSKTVWVTLFFITMFFLKKVAIYSKLQSNHS